jgi:acyl-CoA thioesterase
MTMITDADLAQTGANAYQASLSSTWASMIGIHGGYVAAITAEAIAQTLDPDRTLRSLDTQFIRPPKPGRLDVTVEIINSGRTTTFARATAVQNDKPVLTTTAVAGTDRDGLHFDELLRPANAATQPPPTTPRFTGPEPGLHFEQLDFRLEPGLTIFGSHHKARVAGWLRPLEPSTPVTIPWLICAADFMPPSMVFRTDKPVQAASIDFTVQILQHPTTLVPQGAYIYLETQATVSTQGYTVEDGTLWAPDGTILATSRQLRLAGV